MNKLQQLNEQIAQLKMRRKMLLAKTRLKPESGEIYWYIGPTGAACKREWEGLDSDQRNYHSGNCYFDEHTAQQERDRQYTRQNALDALKKYADGFEPDWTDPTQKKWYPCYDYVDQNMYCEHATTVRIWPYTHLPTQEAMGKLISDNYNEMLVLMGLETKDENLDD